MAEASESTPAPPRRRRWWRWALGAAGLLVAAVVGAVLAMPWWLSPERVRALIQTQAKAQAGLDLSIQGLDYHPLSGAQLRGVRLGPPPGYQEAPFTAEAVRVRYRVLPLLWGEVQVEEVSVSGPVVSLETRGGKDNFTALLEVVERVRGPSPPPEPTPPGPLSPVQVHLKKAFIGPLSLRAVGEGPQLELRDLWARARLSLGDELVTWLKLSAEPAAGAQNLRYAASATAGCPGEAPAPATGPGASGPGAAVVKSSTVAAPGCLNRVALRLEASEVLTATAAATMGVQLRRAQLRLNNTLSGEGRLNGRALPPLSAGLHGAMDAELTAGRVAVSGLRLRFGQAVGLEAAMELQGLWRWLASAGALPGGEAQLPLEQIGAREAPARLGLQAEGLATLAALEPYARVFQPGLRMSGRIEIDKLGLELSPTSLKTGRPRALSGALTAEGISVQAPPLALSGLDLRLQPAGAEDQPLGLSLTANMAQLRQPGLAVQGASFEAAAEVERASAALPGMTRLRAQLEATELRAGGNTLRGPWVGVSVRGQELLAARRPGQPPIELAAGLKLAGASLPPAEGVTPRLSALELHLSAEPAALVAPSDAPIPVRGELRLGRYQTKGVSTRELWVGVSAEVEDPRVVGAPCAPPGLCPRWQPPWRAPLDASQRPFDLRGQIDLRLAGVRAADAEVAGLQASLGLDLRDIGAHPGARGAPATAPVDMDADLKATARRLGMRGPKGQRLAMPGALSVSMRAQLPQGRVSLPKIEAHLGKLLRAKGWVKVRQAFSARPHTQGRLSLEAPDLRRLLARIPPFLKGGAPDLTGEGGVRMSARWRGRAPKPGAAFNPERPPIAGELRLQPQGVGLASEALGLSLSGLNGSVVAAVKPGELLVSPKFGWAELTVENAAGQTQVKQLSVDLQGGLSEGSWLLRGEARAEQLRTKIGDEELVDSASMLVDAGYPRGGEVYVRSLDLHLPATGLVASADGRLRGGRFGALRPTLAVDAQVDLDRLRLLVPTLPGRGRLSLVLTATPRSDRRVGLEGRLGLIGFSYAQPGMSLENATGRIPVEQELWLPAPTPIPTAVLVQGVGPALSARLTQLTERMKAAKLIVGDDNILEVAPKTADHQALEPFVKRGRAELVADALVYQGQPMRDVRMEGALREGVLRLDRFSAGIWEGDMLADMALQITPDLDLRVRLRGTATDLNLDIPYAAAKGVTPARGEAAQDYRASATMDFEFGLRERVVNGRMEVLKISLPLVQRLFGAMDPSQTSGAVRALDASERLGLRPVKATAWIAQNLLNVQFEWEQLFFHIYYPSMNPVWLVVDTALIALRPVTALVGGAWIIQTVNGALNRVPFGSYLETVLAASRPQAKLNAALSGRVISAAEAQATERSGPLTSFLDFPRTVLGGAPIRAVMVGAGPGTGAKSTLKRRSDGTV